MKTNLLLPLTFCLTTPHYFVLSFHYGFYISEYGETPNSIWHVFAIIFGLISSIVLNRSGKGSFCILTIGTFVFILCCVDMFLASMVDSSACAYIYFIWIACFGIGLVQQSVASVFGGMYSSKSRKYFLGYALINMTGICLSAIASHYARYLWNCLIMECYPLNYLICLALSSIGLVILLLMWSAYERFT